MTLRGHNFANSGTFKLVPEIFFSHACTVSSLYAWIKASHAQEGNHHLSILCKVANENCGHITCVVFGMPQKLLLESKETPAGGMGTDVFLFQQVLILDVMLKSREILKVY